MDEVDKASQERLQSEDPRPEFVDLVVGPGRDKDNRTFGELLARIRQHAGRTRVEAAAELGLSAEYLRLIELGRRTPALGQMEKFLKAYQAEGDVMKLHPDGTRPDLLIFDMYNKEPVVVEFESRIREARRSSTRLAEMEASLNDKWDYPESMEDDYSKDLGAAINLLLTAEHATVIKVRKFLQSEVKRKSTGSRPSE